MKKWLPVAAWVASDWITMLQLGWLRGVFPNVYTGIMDFVTPLSMKIHVATLECWSVVKELAVTAFSNTS